MGLFRKASLDRLSSPEQLDLLVEVTTPKGWLALIALLAIIATAVVWSFFGTIPSRVSGMGILVKKGGLSSVSSVAAGQLAEIYVTAGAEVKRGDKVARLSLPDLAAELRNAQATLDSLQGEHEQLNTFGSQDVHLQDEAIHQQRQTAQNQIATARARKENLEKKLASQQKLLSDGLITDQQLQATRDSLDAAQVEVDRAQSALRELSVKETEVRQKVKMSAGERERKIDETKRKIGQLQEKIEHSSMVLSPADGRIVEVRAAPGAIVSVGSPIVLLEAAGGPGQGLEAILYLPGVDGKQVEKAMSAEVSPSTVKREEYGALRAKVTQVSEFPSTQAAMLANLGNQDLVTSFSKQIDTPIEVRVDINSKPANKSGYEWTSPAGPPSTVQPGTLCQATITVRERAPIELVIPLLREKLGL
jgi:HlyD family secretion protein